tara:strand:- start:61662 stop:63815 length:2154 start_codon:yes stop_codon:yes gene_type:complete
MSQEWYATSELAGISGLPKNVRNITIKAAKELWQSRARDGRGGGLEYHLSSLPSETQATLLRKQKPKPLNILVIPDDKAPFSYDEQGLWTHYDSKPQKQKDEAERRLSLLLQVMTLVEVGGMTLVKSFENVGLQNDVSWRTLQGWYHGTAGKHGVKNYKRQDWLAALIPGFVGRLSTANIDDDAWETFKADYLRLEQPAATACYYRLQRTAAEKGWTIPSLKTIERRIKTIPRSIRIFQREGEAGLMRLYPAQTRTVQELHALEWINGDGYQHNVFVKFPNGEIGRPKTWFWQDVYSRKILGYRVDMSENTDTIRLSFGDIVEQYGIPEHATIDNTRAAANKWMTGGVKNRYRFKVKEDDPLGLFPMLGVKVHWTSVFGGHGHGQAKPIERSFGVGGLGEYVDKHPRFEGAYTGANTISKPENYGEKAISIEVFLKVLQQEIIAWNAKTGRRTELGEGVKSFEQIFNESYQSSVIRTATKEQRRLWMLSAEAIKINKDGCFSLDAGKATGKGRNRYHNADLFEYVGHKVVVRFDPESLHQNVYVYTLDGRFICDAHCIEATGFGNTEAARSFNKERERWKKATKISAKAETAMDAIDVADMLPIEHTPEMVDPKIVRPLRAQPKLGRPEIMPDLTPEQRNDFADFNREFNAKPVVVSQGDPYSSIRRWMNLNTRLHAGEQLTAVDQKFWALYQKGDEFRFMTNNVDEFRNVEGYFDV